MRALLILIVVLVIALIVGDRVAVGMAQNEIGRKIAADYSLPNQPSVDIGGFPFLTQAVDGNYHHIDIRVGDWSGQNLSVHNLDVTLIDVAAPLTDLLNNRTSNLVAATATATAVVPYDTVQGFAPSGVESISNSPDGLRVTGTFPVEGIQVPATIVVTVAPTDEGIEVTPVSVQSAAGGPTMPLAMLRRTLTFTVPLQRLPLGAKLTAIQPGADGLHVTAVAHDVRFSDLP
ncbi:LmeA family phospholipid-binding protein [Nocardia sp. CA-128927]|uniref:LmeA family phospholipid-binding protein n=1 Tax=Nocardia sp. CA-128927 TaxID=3239975 RepID=UPI003D972117